MKTQAIVSQPATPNSSPLIQVSGALLGIILLILAAAWLAKRVGLSGVKSGGNRGLKVSASASLGQRERVVIVDVEDARLVLGVTSGQVTLLHTLPPAPAAAEEQKTVQPDFASIIKNTLKRSGRS
ncbi:flagellar biosynthetic protein FliO [Yokenella regensburgei]|uniref:Flagellar protein n=1 Tax=Yokenella regensburgei TaxID=158877 RepID=A0AB38G0U3_9ENTR|nr:flagellar biosynthetic protein FliO [Yokenella regensburgei]KFD21534.1 FliQ family flagellar biosynthesis protein [Yokenella regensburgei ATCC 49455]SQA65101.1 Flagellar protein fliO [Yokenella regensburgei]SQA66334.1 Flagellar protein fliO [Yokenella regensburgei]SUQ04952.1 Flagellar protein fliO [Yokenella regensburgei]